MRSVVVVFPASMCAAIPMFLILSSGTVLAIKKLPAIMCERFVRFGHAMHVVALLDRAATHIRGIVQLVGELLRHTFLRTRPRVDQNPADGQTGPPVLRHLDGHL